MASTTNAAPVKERAKITASTLRNDPWWRSPLTVFIALLAFVIYLTWASLVNSDYFWEPYISPLYSPCLATTCSHSASFGANGIPWPTWLAPAVIIIIGPMGFRFTCYYYRKAYYRAFWGSPPACAVPDKSPVKKTPGKYIGESRFPLIIQNIHRYFFWIAIVFNVILTFDAVMAFRNHDGHWFHMGLGTLIMIANAAMLWVYSLSCHACRHAVGGRLKHFSKNPVRYRMWTWVSRLNTNHMAFAWISLVVVTATDLYIRLVAGGAFSDPRFF